jgi:hypothetical protein
MTKKEARTSLIQHPPDVGILNGRNFANSGTRCDPAGAAII